MLSDFDELNKDQASAPWNVVEMYDSVDEQYDTWKTIFESVLDKHMHGKKMRVRDKDIPYMTEEWKEAIKNKRKHAQVFARRHMLKTGHSKRRAIEAYWATK